MIEIEDWDRTIESFSYNSIHIAKIKTIKGYRWQHEGKYWSFQYDRDMYALRQDQKSSGQYEVANEKKSNQPKRRISELGSDITELSEIAKRG